MAACQVDKRAALQLEERLKSDSSIQYCPLVGNVSIISDACICQAKTGSNLAHEISNLSACFPVGLNICGLVIVSQNVPSKANVETEWRKIHTDLNKFLKNRQHFYLWLIDENRTLDLSKLFIFNIESEEIANVATGWLEDRVNENITVRLQAILPVAYEYDTKKDILEENIRHAVESIQHRVQSDITVFHVEKSNVLLYLEDPSDIKKNPDTENMVIEDLFDHITDEDEEENYSRKPIKNRKIKPVIHVSLLFERSSNRAVDKVVKCSPIIHYEHRKFTNVSLHLPVDVLGVFPVGTPVSDLASQLSCGVNQQLQAMKNCLLKYSQTETAKQPRVYHFKPAEKNTFLSVIHPDGISEEDLMEYRKKLHQNFMLPEDRPVLRKACQYVFPDDRSQDGYLLNPHVGLPPSGVQGGTVHTVYGTYSYHHYMQDRFNDDKWGCAYRSLQTLVSWLRHQGYTTKPVPSHKDIQQVLVDIGDKERSFIGSRKWIGSTEVSYVLDSMFDIQCKILFVSNGAEMSNKGRELAHHFDTQGTPIMIGGGVLAHTILGVDFNDVTGDLKFLILDPHYTGAEDLKVIQDKGWCGWKNVDFWDKTAYYNMCLPQRPLVI